MRKVGLFSILVLLAITAGHTSAAPDWAMNATAIEACSCPHFCMCYFNPHPAAHHEGGGKSEHFCKFNNAYKVNKGHYGATKLDGAKFWINGDLGGDFSQGQMDWAVVTFDKATTPEQRKAIGEIVGHVFPVKWRSLETAEGDIAWTADKNQAHATLDGGKTAEVKLKRFQGLTNEPAVLKDVPYWGTPRNDGFVMMPNEIEAYRVGPKAYEFKGTNGFMLTFDMTSKDVKPKQGTATGY
jgi:hypothetical protein